MSKIFDKYLNELEILKQGIRTNANMADFIYIMDN